jgi:hypothetical protein
MTINEFKAWLEGFEESFTNGSPTPEQWKKIKTKFDKISIVKPIINTKVNDLLPSKIYPYEPYKVWY